MQDKWNVKNKKGYLKINVAVDIKNKQILALEVTDEKVHDSKVLKNLIEGVLNNNHTINLKSFISVMEPMIVTGISNIWRKKGFGPSSK